MSEVAVKFTGDEADLWRALQKVITSSAKMEAGLEKTAKQGDAAEASLRKFAERTKQVTATPIERYQAAVARLTEAERKGLLTKEQLTRALQLERAKMDEATAALARHQHAADKVTNSTMAGTGAMRGAMGALSGTIAQYFNLAQAVQMVVAALRDKYELDSQALKTKVDLAGAQQETIKNLTGLTSEEKRQILEVEVPGIAKRTGFADLAQLTLAVGEGYSASGDKEATLKAIEAAARITRLKPESLSTVAAGALDMVRGSGDIDPEKNLAFLLSVGAPARVKDPADLSKNVSTLVSSGVTTFPEQDRKGASLEIGAVYAALTKLATDAKGEASMTAAAQLLSKLGGEESIFSGQADAPTTLFGRIKAVQETPALREKLFDKEWGEARFKQIFRNLTTAGSDAWKEVEAARKDVSFSPEVYRQTVREQDQTQSLVLATQQKRSEAAVKTFEAGGTRGTEALTLDIVEETLRNTRPHGPLQFMKPVTEWFDSNVWRNLGLANAADRLKARRQELLAKDVLGPLDLPGPMGSLATKYFAERVDPKTLSPETRENIELIDKQLAALAELAAKQQALQPPPARGPMALPAVDEARQTTRTQDRARDEQRSAPGQDASSPLMMRAAEKFDRAATKILDGVDRASEPAPSQRMRQDWTGAARRHEAVAAE